MAQMSAEVPCEYRTAHRSVTKRSGLFSLPSTSAMYRILKYNTTIRNYYYTAVQPCQDILHAICNTMKFI